MNLIILSIILATSRTLEARILVNSSESSPNLASLLNITDNNEVKKVWDPEDNASLYFDDIIHDTLSRNAGENKVKLWPNGLVYFKIDDGFDEERKKYILRAMTIICRVSCVCFIPAEENMTTYLKIGISKPGQYCSAYVGYEEGIVNYFLPLHELDTGCFRIGTILHELMHVIGFIHQHNVPDRDRYVEIIKSNIEPRYWHNFDKWSRDDLPYGDFPYDFSSIMHYNLRSYSNNGEMTIVPLVETGNAHIGLEVALSQLDVQKLNTIYNCTCTH